MLDSAYDIKLLENNWTQCKKLMLTRLEWHSYTKKKPNKPMILIIHYNSTSISGTCVSYYHGYFTLTTVSLFFLSSLAWDQEILFKFIFKYCSIYWICYINVPRYGYTFHINIALNSGRISIELHKLMLADWYFPLFFQ